MQARLRVSVVCRGGPRRVRRVAGADLAYSRDGRRAWAAVVLVSVPEGRLLAVSTASGRPPFPYVPGYLSFREGPLLLRAFARLPERPDLCVFDGQGIAHPRGVGLASHLGVLLDLPSIGCAKSRLVGDYRDPGPARGAASSLWLAGRLVGAVLRTREGVRPIFVSPGHRIGVRAAIRWTLALCRYRVPDPIRLAEQAVNRLRSGRPPALGR